MKTLIIFNIFLLSACSHLRSSTTLPSQTEYVLKQNVIVTSENKKQETLDENKTLKTDAEQILIESPGHVSLLVVQNPERPKKIEIELKKLRDFPKNSTNDYLNNKLDKILDQVNQVQNLLSKRRGSEALNLTKTLQDNYPQVKFLKKLEASCLIVMGQVKEGQNLLKTLNEGSKQ